MILNCLPKPIIPLVPRVASFSLNLISSSSTLKGQLKDYTSVSGSSLASSSCFDSLCQSFLGGLS